MIDPVYLSYVVGLLTALIPCAIYFFFPFVCFKHQDFSKCDNCKVFSCPRSAFWKEPESEPRGLFRFSPVLIFGAVIILAAIFLSIIWFAMICLF